MTLDAMHWVWTNSQSKGNTRLLLLACADRAKTPACEVRLSYADFMEALNATRSAVRDAIRSAEKLGELETVTPGRGTRKALYRLPKAAGYIRPATSSGSNSEPLDRSGTPSSGSKIEPQGANQDRASGSNSDPEQFESRTASGSNSDPHYQYASTSKQERAPEPPQQQPEEHGIPEWARPLVDGLTNAGVIVRWPWRGTQWFPIHSLIKKSGTAAMVAHAVKVAARTNVESARYFLSGWQELPPLPQQQAPAAGDPSPSAPAPEWCGKCDAPNYRWLERDGREYRCPTCNPDAIGART